MKLLRFGEAGNEKPGVLLNGKMVDTSSFGEDYGEAFFETDGLTRLQTWLTKNQTSLPSISEGTRIASCIP